MGSAAKGCYCIRFIALIGCLSLINGVEVRKLSEEQQLEVEKELKRITKPAVKTIQTTYGDTYDCVDFYKQPAFDHPLLKNHSFHHEVKPSSPKGNRPVSGFKPETLWKNGKGCPHGTVPVRRVTKDDLIGSRIAAELLKSELDPDDPVKGPRPHESTLNPDNTPKRHGTHFAVVHTTKSAKYYGAGMSASIWNPELSDNNQYSSCQIKIKNGRDNIIIGWTVNPAVYRDNKTRLFSYIDTANAHCFNTYCGFVLVRPDFPLDAAFSSVSQRGGPIYAEHFFTYKDEANGNWYLQLQNTTDYSLEIGWWPAKLFSANGLGDSASYIEWGGEVYSPPGVPSPQMGSGTFVPIPSSIKDNAHCSRLTIVNEAHQIVDATDLKTASDISDLKTYAVAYEGNIGDYYKNTMFFGGHGGWKSS